DRMAGLHRLAVHGRLRRLGGGDDLFAHRMGFLSGKVRAQAFTSLRPGTSVPSTETRGSVAGTDKRADNKNCLDNLFCRPAHGTVLDVAVIEEPAAAEASLDPIRARILAALAEPGSAARLAARLGLPRQKVNYHLKELERHGLVELAEERRKGNVTERVYRATAASYVISPSA